MIETISDDEVQVLEFIESQEVVFLYEKKINCIGMIN